MFKNGDRFSTVSPLSREIKEVLSGFEQNELILSEENLSRDQIKVVDALKNNDAVKKIRAAQRRLQEHWADSLGVEHHGGNAKPWWQIAGGVSPKWSYGQDPPPGWPRTPPAWDHPSIWKRGKTQQIAVSQPYPWLLNQDIERLDEFAETYGLSFRISNYPSWHYPGRCWFVEWYRNRKTTNLPTPHDFIGQ